MKLEAVARWVRLTRARARWWWEARRVPILLTLAWAFGIGAVVDHSSGNSAWLWEYPLGALCTYRGLKRIRS